MAEEEKDELGRAAFESAQNIVWIYMPRNKPPVANEGQTSQNLESSVQAKDVLYNSNESSSAPQFGISPHQDPDQSHRSPYAKREELEELETREIDPREEEKFSPEDFFLERNLRLGR